MQPMHLRTVVPLRSGTREATLAPMDARVLVPLLAHERVRFVRRARRVLPTEADAEDVVQRAMMRAADRAGSLDDPARVLPWFGRILRRDIAEFHRSRRPDATHDSDATEIAFQTPDAPHRGCSCSVRLLSRLPPNYADALHRVDVKGQSHDAVASTLAVSPANLHVRLHRARRALRERLMKHCRVSTCGPCLDCMCDAHGRCGRSRSRLGTS